MSISLHVNAALAVATAGGASANFGTMIAVAEHTVTANRQDGPYSSLPEVEEAGFTVAAAPVVHAQASIFFQQQPRSSQLLIGRQAAAEHIVDALNAIEAVAPAAFYAVAVASNTANDVMAVLGWLEARSKIGIVQTSDAAVLAGTASTAQVTTETIDTAAAGDWVLEVRDAWTNAVVGTATYNASGGDADTDIATGLRSAFDGVAELAAIAAPAAGAGADVEITFDGLGNGYIVTLTPPGGGAATQVNAAQVQNVAQLAQALGYTRGLIVYHPSDAEHLDVAWLSRCLSFDLDAPNGAAIWAYHRLRGITATRLTPAEKTQLETDACNFYSPVTYTSGVEEPGFTFRGQTPSGQRIDITTTNDVTQAREEEALLLAFLQASSLNQKIGMTDDGIQLLAGAALAVLNRLVRASHFADGAVSSLTGRRTPYIDAPLVSELSPAERAARRVRLTGEAVYEGAVESVGNPSTVGLTIDLSF